MLVSCQNSTKSGITTSYVEEGILNKDAIINDVDKQLSLLVDGIVQKDAEKIFSIFSKEKNPRYVRNGHIYPSLKLAEKQYEQGFKNMPKTSERKFTFKSKHYDVLGDSTVLLTAVGLIERIDAPDDIKTSEIAYTILWTNEPVGWKAINMHISWDEK